ncbi:MAG TPA: hypothetical protein VF174_09010 [Micromonosporaceae bacterium]
MAVTYLLEFPAPAPWLNSNGRTDRRAQTRDRRLWRDAAHIWARSKKLPKLQRAHITATLSFPNHRKRDIGNYAPTMKAAVDGLIDYGLLPDDSDQHLVGPDLRPGTRQCTAYGWVELEIRELP